MNFEALPIDGAYLVHPELIADERGAFGRTYCADELKRQGLNPSVAQCSVSVNRRQGTLRGMHYQAEPHTETKLVRCQSGASFHAIIDLRKNSESFMSWHGVELDATLHTMLYVPDGIAHGFLTLADNTVIHYQMSTPFQPEAARGVRWDDPQFGVRWPAKINVISARDSEYVDFLPSS